MSSLYKLSISGIRSFSPKDHETIQFGSPLTLICGQNGCGKTTIIESLKYVVTGDLPPNSKGGAFVNDPAIADRLLVNAEIKLGFISVDGKLMTVTRNMQLNRKRAARGSTQTSNTFKSLEGQLAVISNGNKTSYSTKNLELDSRVPMYLGASKAVLEYVIFCHQDDSLWPLSEAGTLKKRFDEIFEALKFTKALDNLKLIRKEMASNIKFIEQSVQHSKVDQARARKIRDRLAEATQQAEVYSAEIAGLTVEIEALEKKAERLFHSNQAFQKTLSEHERLSIMIESTGSTLKRLEASIELLPQTEDELSSMLSNFENVETSKRQELENAENLNLEKETQITRLEATHRELVRAEGALIGKRGIYERNQEELALLSTKLSSDYSLENSGDSVSNLEESLNTVRNELLSTDVLQINETKKLEATRTLQEASEKVFQQCERLNRLDEDVELARKQMKQLKATLQTLLSQEDSLEIEKTKLTNMRMKYKKHKASLDFEGLQERINTEKSKVIELERENDELMKSINSANRMGEAYNKVDILKESLSVNTTMLQKYTTAHNDEFQRLVGESLEPLTCEKVLDSALRTNNETLKAPEADLQKTKSFHSAKVSELEASQTLLQQLKTESQTHLDIIKKVIEIDDIPLYEELLKETEEDFKAAQYNCNTFEVTKSFKTKAISIAEENGCCALCNRGMNGDEKNAFITDVQLSILSATFDKLKEDLGSIQKELDDMKLIQYEVREWERKKKALVDVEQLIVTKHSEADNLQTTIALALQKKEKLSQLAEELSALGKPISKMNNLFEEKLNLEKQIESLRNEYDLNQDSKSVNELQKLQQQKTSELKLLRASIEDSMEEKSNKERDLSRLETQVKDKEILVGKLELALNEIKSIQIQIRELESQIGAHATKREVINEKLDELKAQKLTLSDKANLVKLICDKEDTEYKQKLSNLDKAIEKVRDYKKLIHTYESVDLPLLDENRAKISLIKSNTATLRAEKSKGEETIKKLLNQLNDSLSIKRNIRDNIEYRQTAEQLDGLTNSFDALDIENAKLEQKRYQSKSKELREQIAELNSQHYGKVGEVKQINDQIEALQKELQTEFKDVEEKYHTEWINLQTNMLVSTDLQTYSQALDSAIMKYHSMKMNEINRILRDLWNQTYKGTDIDGIEIKCEVSTQNKARSYNYRVVMYKKSSELDMRGRCSAGQKVLTSILIRLALAECFGTNCGMIALDEPTTNLDMENAESLAHALNNIIAFRKSQKNFQLIVITHDEKFLSHIDGDRFTDNFYRVERDGNQHSVIKSLPIHLMQSD